MKLEPVTESSLFVMQGERVESHPVAITSLFAFKARQEEGCSFSTRDDEEDRHLNFLDRLCNEVHDLPTMAAAVRQTPDLVTVPVVGTYFSDDTYGRCTEQGIEIALDETPFGTFSQHFEDQLATLPHEYRHIYQDVRGCWNLIEEPRIKTHLEDRIYFSRIMEADATAFSLTVMYELFLRRGDESPLICAADVHYGSVKAYRDQIRVEGVDAHWNGRAANAAFEAYFNSDNHWRLDNYDAELCKEFSRTAEKDQVSRHRMTVPLEERLDLFGAYLAPIVSMPFVARNGRIAEREAYRPERCTRIMDYLSSEARELIQELKTAQQLALA